MSLRDQFKKANLLSSKDAKRLAHEERVHRTEVGRDGLDQEQRVRLQEIARLQALERGQQKVQQQQTEAERKAAEERAACEHILTQDVTRPGHGRLRFYFETDDGYLPWLEFSEVDFKRMLSSEFAIVRLSGPRAHDYGLLAVASAKRIARLFPERVAWWPKAAGPV